MIASDISPGPLASAQSLVAACGCENIVECRLGAGLSVLRAGEADDVILAGVSGVTVTQILQDAPFAFSGNERFVFIPATKHAALRRWLWQSGFALLAETPVKAALACAVGLATSGPHAEGYLRRAAGLIEKEALGALPAQKERLLALAADVKEVAAQCRP